MNRRTLALFALAAAMPIAYLAFGSNAPDPSPPAADDPRPRVSADRPTSGPADTAATAPPRRSSASLPEEFQVLLKRNIFLGGSQSSRSSRSPGLPPTVEDQFVLRGIMHQSGQYTALIEDLGSRRVRRVVAGDTIARGVLRAVSFDGLEYEGQDAPVRVAIGQKLSGVVMNDPFIAAKPSKSSSERASADRSSGEKSSGEKSTTEKSSGDRPSGEKSDAEHAWRQQGSDRDRSREQEGGGREERSARDATTRVETGG